MANEHVGAVNYLHIGTEATWGTLPGTPTHLFQPCTDYKARFKAQGRQANPFVGLFQRKHNVNYRGMPAGQLIVPLYGWFPASGTVSSMRYLLDWAFEDWEVTTLASKFITWAEGPGVADKRHLGMRVNSATLAGSSDNDQLSLTLDLMGKSEVGNASIAGAPTIPADMEKLADASFANCTFALAGGAVQCDSFSIELQNGLKAEYFNSTTPHLLLKTQRLIKVTMQLAKNADTYDAYNRALGMNEFSGQVVISALHNGTGTSTGATASTVATINFPRLSLEDADTQGGIQDIIKQPLTMFALKPDSSSKDMAITYSES